MECDEARGVSPPSVHDRAQATPDPCPISNDELVVGEFRAHAQFGGYALDRLTRTWAPIMTTYGVPHGRLHELLQRAGLRVSGNTIVNPANLMEGWHP
jgi:hypothetical protein